MIAARVPMPDRHFSSFKKLTLCARPRPRDLCLLGRQPVVSPSVIGLIQEGLPASEDQRNDRSLGSVSSIPGAQLVGESRSRSRPPRSAALASSTCRSRCRCCSAPHRRPAAGPLPDLQCGQLSSNAMRTALPAVSARPNMESRSWIAGSISIRRARSGEVRLPLVRQRDALQPRVARPLDLLVITANAANRC